MILEVLMGKRKVILITDGDRVAKEAVEIASKNIGARCISSSAGNPTVLTGQEIIERIMKAEHDPVVVMVDDRGIKGKGPGEEAMEAILKDERLDVLGIIAVSSNGKDCNGLEVTCSITKDGNITEGAVDKYGNDIHSERICGDTLSILKKMKHDLIIGMGDPGKMDFNDEVSKGAPITTKAMKEILRRSGM